MIKKQERIIMKKSIKKRIIPTILAYSKDEFLYKYNKIKQYHYSYFQIDVVDPVFTSFPATWATPKKVRNLNLRIPFEVHSMEYHPEKNISAWKKAGATRIYIHYEAVKNPLKIAEKIQKAGLEPGLAISPHTSVRAITLILPSIHAILLLGVTPGKGGQRFQQKTLKKISALRATGWKGRIAVDGGITHKNAINILRAGADILASGTCAVSKTYIHI
jgi:ribulose-phosphate 3-epimerase